MNVNWRFWIGSALALTGLGAFALWQNLAPVPLAVLPIALLVVWGTLWLGSRGVAQEATGEKSRGIWLAFGLLILLTVAGFGGLVLFQPMRSDPPTLAFWTYSLVLLWLLTFAVGFNTDDERLRAFGRKVSGSPLSGLLVFLVAAVALLGIAEWGLRLFAIQSFGASSSILTRNYLGVVWGEPNSLGFRDDREPTPPADDDTQALLVVGDSVAAGFGLDQRADRFASIVDARFDNLAVYLVAKPGWEAQTQLAELQAYPVPPDVVVVSYFINDVNEAYADQYGDSASEPSISTNFLVDNLFVPSFLYWNLFLDDSGIVDVTGAAQSDETVLATHADEIREVITWTRAGDAEIVYVIWAHPALLDGYDPLLNTVRAVLDEEAVPYVDMGPLMAPYPVRERVATVYDPHPSVEMHALAAAELANLLLREGILSENS